MIGEQEEQFLRQAFSVARRSQENGSYPFAAILVSENGGVRLEA
jgi:tRNA(Arg) A34 adenosine deaminase TadA